MKKVFPIIVILLCIMAFTSADASTKNTLPSAELYNEELIREFVLPASVEIIADEAFEGTALVNVELPQTVMKIGERAFANISSLREIRIPSTVSFIATSAFEGSDKTTITAPADSYARTWAKEHDFPYSPIIMFRASTSATSTFAIFDNRSKEIIESDSSTELRTETQWRRIEEIKTSRTKKKIANHVQGRSPPMM